MASFEMAIPAVLRHEGGYVNDPSDPGGMTNRGITQRSAAAFWVNDVVDEAFMRALTTSDARAYYKAAWWDKLGLGRLLDDGVATKLLDTAVNVGAPRAVKMAQRAVGGVEVDGCLGPATVCALNAAAPGPLLEAMRSEQAAYYRDLADRRPTSRKFLAGWLKRAAS